MNRNTLTYEKITMADAIMKGFLKAKPIEDASMIEIDPENEMTIHAWMNESWPFMHEWMNHVKETIKSQHGL